MNRDPFEGLFKRGLAMGHADVRNDEMTFRFRKELFTFPTMVVHQYCQWTGYFYQASVKDLRKLKSKLH